jgi:hypothetical protein
MAGLVPAIHVSQRRKWPSALRELLLRAAAASSQDIHKLSRMPQNVDGRDKPGHDAS